VFSIFILKVSEHTHILLLFFLCEIHKKGLYPSSEKVGFLLEMILFYYYNVMLISARLGRAGSESKVLPKAAKVFRRISIDVGKFQNFTLSGFS
jgi:hypothetical protein